MKYWSQQYVHVHSIRWIKNEYNNPVVYITENGFADFGGLKDNGRTKFIHDHLDTALDAVINDKCNLKGYTGIEIHFQQIVFTILNG